MGMMFIRTSLRGSAGSQRSATSSEDDIYLHVTPGERGIPAKCHFKWGLYLSPFRPGRAGDPSEVQLQVAMIFITTSLRESGGSQRSETSSGGGIYLHFTPGGAGDPSEVPLQVGMVFISTSPRGGGGSQRSATSSGDGIYFHFTPGGGGGSQRSAIASGDDLLSPGPNGRRPPPTSAE